MQKEGKDFGKVESSIACFTSYISRRRRKWQRTSWRRPLKTASMVRLRMEACNDLHTTQTSTSINIMQTMTIIQGPATVQRRHALFLYTYYVYIYVYIYECIWLYIMYNYAQSRCLMMMTEFCKIFHVLRRSMTRSDFLSLSRRFLHLEVVKYFRSHGQFE